MNITAFDNWSKERGITSTASIQKTPYAGYGLYSSQTIKNDSPTVVVHIPEDTLLTSRNALEADSRFAEAVTNIISQKYPDSDNLELLAKSTENEKMVLCLFLIYCKFFQPLEIWKPYIDILPAVDFFQSNHILFDPGCITGTNLENSVNAKRASLERELEEITSIAQQLEEEGENSMHWLSNIQLDMYLWSDCIFWSRVVGIGGDEDAEESNSPDMALIPYFDFANHSSDSPNIRWKRNMENHGIDLVTYPNKIIVENQELLLSYGSKPNQELLFLHGFCIQDNQEHSRLTLPLLPFLNPANGIYNMHKIHWLKSLGAKPTLTFAVDYSTDNDDNLFKCGWSFDSIAIMYLVALDEDEGIEFSSDEQGAVSFTLSGNSVNTLNDLTDKVKELDIHKIIELRVTCLLLDALEYHYSLNTEIGHAEDKDKSALWKHASIYRAEEKESIKLAMSRLSNIRDNLMQDSAVLAYLEGMQDEQQ